MNLLLLESSEINDDNTASITGRRATHLIQVNKVKEGDSIKAGEINGLMGKATINKVNNSHITLSLQLNRPPPEALPACLVMALPRPKMLKRILQTVATMGVKELYFINSYRVEKSYWQSPLLTDKSIQEHLLLGLEQGCDTLMPRVHLEKRFKPFVEDHLPTLCLNKRALVAHPYTETPCPKPNSEETLLVVGPEGGFIPYEIDKLVEAGCSSIHLGKRILRVETAIPVLLAKLF